MVVNTPLSVLHIHAEDTDTQAIAGLLRECNSRSRVWSVMTLRDAQNIQRDHAPDIVLVEPPSGDGQAYKYFQRFLDHFRKLPIVLLTGRGNEIIGMQAIRAGAQDYLVRPLSDARAFHRALQFAHQRHQLQLQAEETCRKNLRMLKKGKVQQSLAGLGMWEMDLLDQNLYMDRYARQLWGMPDGQDGLSRQALLERVQAPDRGKVEGFLLALSSANQPESLQFRVLHEGRKIRHLEARAQIYLEEESSDMLVLGFFRESRHDPEELQETTNAGKTLTQSTMITLRERLLDDIGFFVRTPLYSIVNFIHLLDDLPLRKTHQDALLGLKDSVDELQHYLNRLMNFSLLTREISSPDIRPFNLAHDLDLISRLLYLRNNEDVVRMEVRIDENIPTSVIGDQALLYRIMVTLHDFLRNLETSPRRISIHIGVESQINNWFNLRILCRDPFQYPSSFAYRELLEKSSLAARYEERPENENLSRMNLITLHEMIRTMNGSIRLHQLPTGSLRMQLSMPYRFMDKPDVPPSLQEFIEPIRILLVEDHFLNQIATRNVLQSWSEEIHVDVAENGLVAVQKFREHGYDLILMDIQMPEMNGLEATRKIRETSDVPIIALSAISTEQEARRCIQAGVNVYMAKPFQPEELKMQVFRLVSAHR